MRGTLDKTEVREWVIIENCGQKLFGVLHRPIDSELPTPLVLFFHGYGSSKLGSNQAYVKLAELLTQAGIAALRFDFRGSGDSEGDLSELTLEDLLSDGIKVLESAEFLEGINFQQIAIFGASLGGSLAILSATHFTHLKALALWAPVASGQIWYQDFLSTHPKYANCDPSQAFSEYRGIPIHPLFRDQFAKMEAFKAISELKDLPILMMHAQNDQIITLAHQEAFKKGCAMKRNARFITYPQGEHALGFSSCFQEVCKETVDWFKKYLF